MIKLADSSANVFLCMQTCEAGLRDVCAGALASISWQSKVSEGLRDVRALCLQVSVRLLRAYVRSMLYVCDFLFGSKQLQMAFFTYVSLFSVC